MEVLDAVKQTDIAAYQPFYAELAKLEQDNAALVFDYESPKGNKEARSYLHKLSLTCGALERARVAAKEESLRIGRAVDAEAKEIEARIRAMMNVHQVKIDEIANREKERVDALRKRLDGFHPNAIQPTTIEGVKAELALIEAIEIDPTWQEYMAEAATRKANQLTRLRTLLADYEKRDADAAELERLRKETAEREQRERDAAIAAAAAEQVRKEEAARAEAAAAAAKKQIEDAEAAGKAAAEAAHRREIELKEAAAEAERRRVAAEEQAKRDAEAAAKRAEEDKQRAIKAEQDRVAAEAAAAAKEQADREADIKHRGTINGAALAALVAAGVNEELGKKVITLIAQRKVPHISIAY